MIAHRADLTHVHISVLCLLPKVYARYIILFQTPEIQVFFLFIDKLYLTKSHILFHTKIKGHINAKLVYLVFVLKVFRNTLPFHRYLGKTVLNNQPYNSFMGTHNKQIMTADCLAHF